MDSSACSVAATTSLPTNVAPLHRIVTDSPSSVGTVKLETPAETGEKDVSMHGRKTKHGLNSSTLGRDVPGYIEKLQICNDCVQLFYHKRCKAFKVSVSSGRSNTAFRTLAEECCRLFSSKYLSRWLFGENRSTWVFNTWKYPQCRL